MIRTWKMEGRNCLFVRKIKEVGKELTLTSPSLIPEDCNESFMLGSACSWTRYSEDHEDRLRSVYVRG